MVERKKDINTRVKCKNCDKELVKQIVGCIQIIAGEGGGNFVY